MMDDEERAELVALPEPIIGYRGCYGHNIDGVSWSLDESIAMDFPFQDRYRADQSKVGPPLLARATVKKPRFVLKLDRGERDRAQAV